MAVNLNEEYPPKMVGGHKSILSTAPVKIHTQLGVSSNWLRCPFGFPAKQPQVEYRASNKTHRLGMNFNRDTHTQDFKLLHTGHHILVGVDSCPPITLEVIAILWMDEILRQLNNPGMISLPCKNIPGNPWCPSPWFHFAGAIFLAVAHIITVVPEQKKEKKKENDRSNRQKVRRRLSKA